MTMGDRVAVLKDGILQQVDTPRNLYDSPGNAFVAGFIGSPAMNLVKVPVSDSGAQLGSVQVPLKQDVLAAIRAAGLKEIILGIRPESFHASQNGGGLRLKATLVEELGADAFVYGELPGVKTQDVGDDGGAKPFTVRFDGRVPPKIGNEIALEVRTEETHVFNPDTGERLGS
jgi:multiple sugar transport system ATP-binding protein